MIASQLPDLLWLPLHSVGLEPTETDNVMSVSLDAMSVDMTYSHDLLPVLGWIVLAAMAGCACFGGWPSGALVATHSVTDNLAGYSHHLFGPDSVNVSTGMYPWSPYLTVGIEAAFVGATMAGVILADRRAGMRRTLGTWAVRGAVFVGGVTFMFSVADLSMADLTGIEPLALLSGSTMPIMTSMYAALIITLSWVESRPAREPAVAEAEAIGG